MANINPNVCMTSQFLRLSSGAKALYLMLLLCADGQGLCDVTIPMQINGLSSNELRELISAGYVLAIPQHDNIVCIRHWLLHNPGQQNRKTGFPEARRMLRVKDNLFCTKEVNLHEEEK